MQRHGLTSRGGLDACLLGMYIREAREGRTESLGLAFQSCERYLRLMAEIHFPHQFRAKVTPSDLVQETFLAAHGDFANFRGSTGQELIAWLKQIMRNMIAEAVRNFTSQKRSVDREIRLSWIGTNSERIEGLASHTMTPVAWLIYVEEIQALDRAMEKLSPRELAVLEMINGQELGYGRAGAALGLSYDQTRREWHRILQRLRDSLHHPATRRAD